jgi:hypothetical protein
MPCCLGLLFIFRLLLGFFIKQDILAEFVRLHRTPRVGNKRKRRSQVRWEPSGFFRPWSAALKPRRKDMWCIPQLDGEYVARMEAGVDDAEIDCAETEH